MPTVSIRVSDDLKSRLDTLAQESESTLSGVIVEALNSITGLGREDYPEATALPGYVEYLFADNRYTELAEPLSRFSDDGNSYHRNLDVYRRMLRCFNQLWRKHIISFDLLSLGEIKQVVSAAPYNSGY